MQKTQERYTLLNEGNNGGKEKTYFFFRTSGSVLFKGILSLANKLNRLI